MIAAANSLVQKTIERAIGQQGEIGIQVAAYLNGEQVIDAWGGLADETTGRLVDGGTLFCAWSTTKAVAAVALHIQAERGLIDYSAPVARYWPEFGCNGKDNGTVFDLLTHRLGVPLMPADTTPELMCDWDWVVSRIARMTPVFEPGTRTAYLSRTFGWIIGEIVRRTDPHHRPFRDFVEQEICQPLGIDNLWIGIPDGVESRVAKMTDIPPLAADAPGPLPGLLFPAAIPPVVAPTEEVFGRPDVRRACIPSSNGIMNARSLARFFAMLAGGGQLDGVRLLSQDRVRLFTIPRPPCFYDLTVGIPNTGSIGGFHLVSPTGHLPRPVHMAPAGTNLRTFGHPGFGGQIGWADPDEMLAVGILHNRMLRVQSPDPQQNPIVAIGNAVREALGIAG